MAPHLVVAARLADLRALLEHLQALHAPTAGLLAPYAVYVRLQVVATCDGLHTKLPSFPNSLQHNLFFIQHNSKHVLWVV